MDAWGDIRLKARECHQRALVESKGNRKSDAIIAAALTLEDLQLQHYEPGTIVGHGVHGFLDRGSLMVYVASGQSAQNEAVVIAHEIGHFKLHRDPRNEVTAIAPGLGGDSIDSGASRVEGYSSRERKEVQADVFAGEFLCPSDRLREQLTAGKRPGDIAKDLELPYGLVMNQTIRALLLPPLQAPAAPQPMQAFELDGSQLEAAAWSGGPLLVDAGPGTGKTRTLVYRIQRLMEQGVSPASILALTFSNKAAEEMRERLSAANADAAIEMWVGTFHQFGLELITKYHDRVGRSDKVHILDEAGSLAILEDNLTRLPLRYFQNLYEPAYELVHVLRAISRCKDELITPAVYRAEAEAALAAAMSDEQRELAEKALEVACIYEIYEDLVREADAVDFGDLVLLSARILEEHADIRSEYQGRFEHILVDEYQDVNLASARLLRALRGPAGDVWVVADPRQSIYRFRGAEPSSVLRFETEFSGSKRSLKVNYRSGAPVVQAVQTFAANMRASPGGSWTPKRGDVGALANVFAPSVAGEAVAIRDHIEAARAKGIPYSDQAILARSHLTLARITGALEALGVPLLYLGDLFERPEIRDLLSLISIDSEWGGIGLVRVAQLDEYGASKDDALAVISWARENRVPIIDALNRTAEIDGFGETGRKGLAALGAHLKGVGPATTPWTLLTTWLFERSGYLTSILSGNDAQQRLIAIYQFLKVCGEIAESGHSTRRRFLARIRRIEALNDERMYRAVASEASNMDAVRVLTIHGSKGLEFRAVHLPALATRYMPANRQGIRCPPPPTLAHLAIRPEDHEAEEECLFFVALSRARDLLYLSRAERYTRQNASPSKFLSALASLIPARQSGDGPVILKHGHPPDPPQARQRYEERANQAPAGSLQANRPQAAVVTFAAAGVRRKRMSTFRFIHTGDIHLDSPLKGLSRQEGAAAERIRTATRAAFSNLIDSAIEEEVAFVIIAGDLYDGDWRDYQTGLFFVKEMGRLAKANIPAFLIYGNHDAENQITKRLTFPDNVRVFPSRKAATIKLEGYCVALHGQSFKLRAVTENLVPEYPAPVEDLFNIGILHTGLGGMHGHANYAPCSVDDLVNRGYDYWALAHVHQGAVLHRDPYVVFCGNLQGRHIREDGVKGATLVSVEDGAVENVSTIEADVVRWMNVPVDAEGAVNSSELFDRVRRGIESAVTHHAAGRLLACRVELTGRTGLHDEILSSREQLVAEARAAALALGDEAAWIERLVIRTLPVASASALQATDALTELQTIAAEAPNDPGLRSQFDADIGELVRKLPHELKAGLEDSILKAAADGDHSQVIERASRYLTARLGAEGV